MTNLQAYSHLKTLMEFAIKNQMARQTSKGIDLMCALEIGMAAIKREMEKE